MSRTFDRQRLGVWVFGNVERLLYRMGVLEGDSADDIGPAHKATLGRSLDGLRRLG